MRRPAQGIANAFLALMLAAATAREGSAAASAVDGTWTVDAQLTPRSLPAIYDPLRDRMISLYGGLSPSGLWVMNLGGLPGWMLLDTSGGSPGMRPGQSVVYDSRRDRILVFGGAVGGGVFGNEVFALTLAGTPTWTKVMPTGPLPIGRWRQAAIYDPVRDRLLIFGGTRDDVGELNDLWALSLGDSPAWSRIDPAATPPDTRYGPGAVYDPVRDQMVVFGGIGRVNGVLTIFNDVWAVPLAGPAAWTPLAPAGLPPDGRSDMCLIYDAPRDQLVMFAGARLGLYRNDCWELSLSGAPAWHQVVASGPVPEIRTGAGGIYDSLRGWLVVFGGYGASHVATTDAWALPLGEPPRWQPLRAPPHPRVGHRAVLDTNRDRMIVFGDLETNDVSTLSLVGPPIWTPLAPVGSPPSARIYHSAIYDPIRDRMLVFGGLTGAGSTKSNDLWSLSLTGTPTWAQLTPAGVPPSARALHSAIYDPIRDRMLVFGGFDGSVLNDLWELSLAGPPRWTPIVLASPLPPVRQYHQAICDPVRDRMLVFGGANRDGSSPYSDVWSLMLWGSPSWLQEMPGGELMEGRWGHTAIYDSARDRMVVFGGIGPGGSLNYDTWELKLEDVGTWTSLSRAGFQPTTLYDHSAIYDAARDRMIVFGGDDGDVMNNDLWTLEWTASAGVPPTAGSDIRLSPVYPDPAQGPVTIEFTLPRPGPASVRLYDASGRFVRALTSGELSAGPHSVRWDGQLGSAGRAPAGIYFCVLDVLGSSMSRRFVLLR